jgi:hypothetical protein
MGGGAVPRNPRRRGRGGATCVPRPAEEHDELAVLETLPWFEPGRLLRNWMVHETDFYDEVVQT